MVLFTDLKASMELLTDHDSEEPRQLLDPVLERMEECLWLQERTTPFALIKALKVWIADCNEHYLHSVLGYKSPSQFEHDYHLSHGSQFAAT